MSEGDGAPKAGNPAPKASQFTEGSVVRSVLRMGLPSMIGFAASNIYDIVDMFWVAKLGASSVAAVTLFFSFYWIITSANQIAGTGSVAVISRRFGEDDIPGTEAAIKESILLKLGLALIVGLVGYKFLWPVLRLLGAEGEILRLAASYGSVQLLGLGVSFSSFTIYTALRGVGEPRKAMVLMIAGVVINLILDPFLIFGWGPFPRLEVAGAAYASIISYGFTFLVGLGMFYGGFSGVRLHLRGVDRVRFSRMMKILRIGFPSGINSLSFTIGRAMIMPMVAAFGANVVAVYGMSMRVTALGIMIIVGMGLGLSALIGQNLGAGKPERAWETSIASIKFLVGVTSVFGLLLVIFARPITSAFFSDPSIIAMGVPTMRIFALGLPLAALGITFDMSCSGAGENRAPMLFSMLHTWGLQIPFVLIATKLLGLGYQSVWWAMMLSGLLGPAFFWFTYFRRKTWLQRTV
ncbi:MATE family efflux transporter [bacterium]|nr:MATE family efflux transporter [bacterium]